MSSSLARRWRKRNRNHSPHQRAGTQTLAGTDPFTISPPLANRGPSAFEAVIVERDEVPAMFQAALSGDVRACTLAQAIERWIADAARAKPGKGPICLDCDIEFSPHTGNTPAAFTVVMPFATSEGHIIVSGVCEACNDKSHASHDSGGLMVVGMRRWRQIWPDLRVVSATASSSAAH